MRFGLKLSACVLVVAGYAIGLWYRPFSVITFLLGIPVCNWLANLFHELGHLLAYRLLNLEWKRMMLFCLVFEKGKGLRIDGTKRIFDASCTCAYDREVPVWRYQIALLSGGFMGVLVSAGAIVAGYGMNGALKAILMCFGIVCGLNAAANLLLPFSADRALITQIKQEREKSS